MGEQSCGCRPRVKADRVHTDEGRKPGVVGKAKVFFSS